jgi:general secretion pathway protein C
MSSIFKQYSWLVDLIAVLFCSFFLAKIVGVYLGKTLEYKRSIAVLKPVEKGPEEVLGPDISEYKIILERNIFDSTELPPEEGAVEGEAGTEGVPTGEAVKTALDIKVIGVLVVGDGKDNRSSTTVVGPGGKGSPNVYAVGDAESFATNTKLTKVAPDRIEFLNSGRLEYAEVGGDFGASIFGPPPRGEVVAAATPEKKEPAASMVKAEGGGKFAIDQKEIENAMSNLDKLYTDIRAVPNFEGGKVSGMKVLSVRSGSLFSKLGLQRGDILQRINGIELDVRKGFEIFNQLKDQKSLTVDLIRQGSQQTFEYEVR